MLCSITLEINKPGSKSISSIKTLAVNSSQTFGVSYNVWQKRLGHALENIVKYNSCISSIENLIVILIPFVISQNNKGFLFLETLTKLRQFLSLFMQILWGPCAHSAIFGSIFCYPFRLFY